MDNLNIFENRGQENLIKQVEVLKESGLSYRDIAKKLNISLGKVQRILTVSPVSGLVGVSVESVSKKLSVSESDTLVSVESDNITYPNGHPKADFNNLGVRKLRKSDHTKEELKIFPDTPYYDE